MPLGRFALLRATALSISVMWIGIPDPAGAEPPSSTQQPADGGRDHSGPSIAENKRFRFERPLQLGDTGKDVKALQVRVAGWFSSPDQVAFGFDGVYGRQTERAVMAFRKGYGLHPSPRAGRKVLRRLERLQDPDGSTAHFDWVEFMQNSSASCSEKANASAGSFKGGPVRARVVKRNVKRMMWRLEAIRHKVGDKTIGINSGFRSIAYNKCIGGASGSQHLYGTAADLRIADTDNALARDVAKKSQMEGIGCYSALTHNHFDLRMENPALPDSRAWWWPETDKKGRDLDEEGKRCWGQGGIKIDRSSILDSQIEIAGVVIGREGTGSTEPSSAEVEAFEATGESGDYHGAD